MLSAMPSVTSTIATMLPSADNTSSTIAATFYNKPTTTVPSGAAQVQRAWLDHATPVGQHDAAPRHTSSSV